MAPKAELTSDHFVILPKAGVTVDRPPVSFLAVLLGMRSMGFLVPTYFRATTLWMVIKLALRSISYPRSDSFRMTVLAHWRDGQGGHSNGAAAFNPAATTCRESVADQCRGVQKVAVLTAVNGASGAQDFESGIRGGNTQS
jgi:hypothetical protein